ncbi:MAG: DUF3450 family protein [Pseudomonadota bacterium]|nr:DUF3450 family protein [Pseudomonadota bacterium]
MFRLYNILLLSLLISPVGAQQAINEVDGLTEKWLGLERQERRLLNEWQQQAPTMQQRIQLLQAEKAQLADILAQGKANQGDVEQQREALLASQSDMETQQEKLTRSLATITARVNSLYSALPDPVRTLWDEEQSQLADSTETSANLQVVLAKLSALHRFNQQLTVNETIITAPDEQDVLVKQFYLGAGYAWFTNASGRYQGTGEVIEGEWQWHFDESLTGDEIAKAIAIYEKRKEPGFVELPVSLSSATGGQ